MTETSAAEAPREAISDEQLWKMRRDAYCDLDDEEFAFAKGDRLRPRHPTPAQRQLALLDEVERLRGELAAATEERDLAIAHDRQPYPTAWAYQQTCNALHTQRERAEAAERELAELRGRHDVMGHTRAEIAHELRDAARWHPDNATWTQDMDQAARIAKIGLDAYAAENELPRLGGYIRNNADTSNAEPS